MKIKPLKGEFIEYNYVVDRNVEHIEDRFIKNTIIALDYLVKSSALTISYSDNGVAMRVDVIDVLVADKENNITIVSDNKNAYSPSYNTILFYDTHGVVFRKNHKKKWFRRNKGYNSPVALLSHQLIHRYNEIYDPEDYHAC